MFLCANDRVGRITKKEKRRHFSSTKMAKKSSKKEMMKTKAKKKKNSDKNKERTMKQKPTNAVLRKLVIEARVKETSLDGNEETAGANQKKIQNHHQEHKKQKKKKKKKKKKADENNNNSSSDGDDYASLSNDNDDDDDNNYDNNTSIGLREEKPFDTNRKKKIKDMVEYTGGVEKSTKEQLLRIFSLHIDRDADDLFRRIGTKMKIEELEKMDLEPLKTMYKVVYDHLDSKEEGIAYAKKHLFVPTSPKENRMSAPIVYISPDKNEHSDLFPKRYGRNPNKKKRQIDEGVASMIDTKKKTKNENTAETFKATKAASTVCARNKKEHVLIEKNDARVSRKNSSKSDLALALPSTDRNNKQQKLPVGVWNKKKFYKKVKVEDEVFKVGDDVYVCTPETVDLTEDVDHICELCKKTGVEEGADGKEVETEMLECDYCVRSWHLRCLKLDHVPDETFWSCPMCVAAPSGIAAPQNFHERRTPCGEFLAGRLCLARIESIWANVDELNDRDPKVREEAFKFIARLYVLPEHTHTGRQRHHIRREVFLTNIKEEENCAAILMGAKVLEPAAFRSSGGNDDVYMCEYSYDQNFSRFRRRTEWEDSDFSEDECDIEAKNILWSETESSDDDDDDYDHRKEKRKAEKRAHVRQTKADIAASKKAAASKKGANASSEWKEAIGLGKSGILAIDSAQNNGSRTAIERARKALQLSSIPAKLECREKEREKIMQFTKNAIGAYGGASSCLGNSLYISGVPGTGKTATVREVIRTLRQEAANKKVPKFNHIEMNGLRLQTPQHAYSLIAEELTGRRFSPSRAAEWLEKRFKEGKESDGRVLVLVVDELDVLVTQTQSVLYNIFDWPTYKASNIAVIGIANTMDLPERLLPKIASRLGSGRVTFNPYNTSELIKIIEARLRSTGDYISDGKYDAITQNAVQLASMKVAQISGDARRALELCRRGIEIAEARIARERDSGELNCVSRCGPNDISKAQNEMFSATYMKMLKGLSKHERIFLAALLLRTRQLGYKEVYVSDVLEVHEKLCMNHSVQTLPTGFETTIVCRLHSMRLVLADPGYMRRLQKVSLNIPQEQAMYSLKDDMLCADMRWIKNAL